MSDRTIGELLTADIKSFDREDMEKMIDYQSQRRAVLIAYNELLQDQQSDYIKNQDHLQSIMDEADKSIKEINEKDEKKEGGDE